MADRAIAHLPSGIALACATSPGRIALPCDASLFGGVGSLDEVARGSGPDSLATFCVQHSFRTAPESQRSVPFSLPSRSAGCINKGFLLYGRCHWIAQG